MGIYKRKQDCKKNRKHALDQENDQENTKVFFFLDKGTKKDPLTEAVDRGGFFIMVENVYSCFQELDQECDQADQEKEEFFFLDHFLGRVLVFLLSYLLVFFYKFPPLY